MRKLALPVCFAALYTLLGHSALAGQESGRAPMNEGPVLRIDGPPAPVSPDVINRDDQGAATVRAIRLSEPLRLDGRLDESVYGTVPPITGFFQIVPDGGEPATEETDVWITFDADNVYVSARLWESAPESEWVANEMRRDTRQLRNNDTFTVFFDTYYDRRNGVFFYTNPLGARFDAQVMNEGSYNVDWNPIWDVRTGRFNGGWTVEMQFPFRSLRYRPGNPQVWGIQLRRAIRRKNEWAHLTKIPQSAISGTTNPGGAIGRASAAGTLVGLEVPEAGRGLEMKPYVISGLETDRVATPAVSNDAHADVGLDLKLGISENLTADFTLNTDFAQVEVDEQQVNLTRFELSFPEKREFFLEGRGIFEFASRASSSGIRSSNVPDLFFSRRIGLHSGKLVPIMAGGRVTGKVGAFDLGALNMQTGAHDALGLESTNFTVFRLRRDLFRRSGIGVLFTRRSESLAAPGSSLTYGVDGSFSFMQDLNVSSYFAETNTPGVTGNEQSYQGTFSYSGNLWGAAIGYLRVGAAFNPEIGFLRRRGFRETVASAQFSPRPQSIDAIRRIVIAGSVEYLEDDEQRYVESRQNQASFQLELESSDIIDLSFADTYEFLESSFRIADDVLLPAGRYSFRYVNVGLGLGLQRRYSGRLSWEHGSFYSGDKTTVGLSSGRINVSDRLSLEPTLSFNWVDLPEGSFRSDLAVTRVNYAFSTRMFLGGLVQYNSGNDSFSTNFRLRWEYMPGSELFVVYTEARDTDVLDRFSVLENRGLTIKVNYLLRL